MPSSDEQKNYLQKVERELARYEHPLFYWRAEESDRGIKVIIYLKYHGIYDDPYIIYLTPRELEARAFEWDFQRQLYNYLHDYIVEMFTKSPQIREY